MGKFNYEEYRQPWETGPHWELKREFLERYQDDFPEDRLLCLAQAYSNIELLHCSYPNQVMLQIHELSKPLKANKRFRSQNYAQSSNDEAQRAQKGKRSCSGPESVKKSKFIKFCSSDDKPLNNLDDIEKKPQLSIGTNIDYSAILQSPDLILIEKLATQVQKLLLLRKTKPVDAIQSAALLLNAKKSVFFTFRQESNNSNIYYCELFIGATRISAGDGSSEGSAKKKAAEYALNALMHFRDLPTNNLTNLQKTVQSQKFTSETQDEDMIVSEIKENSLAVTDTSLSMDLNSKLDINFLHSFAEELKKTRSKREQNALLSLNETGRRMKIFDLLVFNFSEDLSTPIHNRLYICDFSIKNVLISQGNATSKKKARNAAAENGIKYLLNLIEQDEICSGSKISQTNNKPIAAEFNTFNRNNATTLEKSNSELMAPKSTLDVPLFIDFSNKKSAKKICGNTYAGPCSVQPVVSNTHSNSSDTIISSKNTVRQTCSLRINKRLLNNSLRRGLVLFDRTDVASPAHLTPGFVLSYSIQQSHKKFSYEESIDQSGLHKANALLNEVIIGTGVGQTKVLAKSEAAKSALENLRKEVYTIKVKTDIGEGQIINRNQMLELSNETSDAVSDDNIGCKMLKMMGWSGGGIGKTGGIVEPISVKDHTFGKGLGYDKNGSTDMRIFTRKVEALLKDYCQSNTTLPLIFSTEFLKSERKEIHRIAAKYKLVNNSYGKDAERQLCIRRKITINELLNSILQSGGSTKKYELVDMSS